MENKKIRQREANRKYREKNKEKINMKKREWRKLYPKECSLQGKKWREKHKEERREYNRLYRPMRIKKLRKWYQDFRIGKVCAICGESHPACLDFHHKDSSSKEGVISSFLNYGKKRMLQEIAKCEILCSNCHRKYHFEKRKNKNSI